MSDLKQQALESIVNAMGEVEENFASDANMDVASANAEAMKKLAEAFSIVSRIGRLF